MTIKDLRIQKGWSQEDLAEKSNLSSRTIQRIEKDNKASLESINALCLAFNIEVQELQKILSHTCHNEEITNLGKENIDYKNFFEYLKKDKRTGEFLLVNALLIIINLVTTPSYIWFIYPLLGWGIPHFYKRYKSYKELNHIRLAQEC